MNTTETPSIPYWELEGGKRENGGMIIWGATAPRRIVRLNPETVHNPMFAGCLLITTEVAAWGVKGYVQSLGENGEPGGQAFYRASYEEICEVWTPYWP